MSTRPYDGPFTPPPANLLRGAIGWRFTKLQVPGESRWEPKGWEVFYSDHVVEYNLAEVGVRSSSLYEGDTLTERDVLLEMHMMLFPERYAPTDHVYWSNYDPSGEDDPEFRVTAKDYVREHGPFAWSASTPEWVAQMLERALADHPDAKLKP